jgi:putative addiction module killer protein
MVTISHLVMESVNYFAEEEGGMIVILLCGGDKSSQVQDIKTAKMYWQELLERDHE